MKRLVRSFILATVALCITTALLVPPLTKKLKSLSLLPSDLLSRDVADASPGSGKTTGSILSVMHAHDRAELERTVARINGEFGLEVTADQFSSHHVARDYLERLCLAKRAQAAGIVIDPHAFGDDACMRRAIDGLLGGRSLPELPATAMAASAPSPGVRRDSIFIYGHKYYRDADGTYVRADGTMLAASQLGKAQRGRQVASPAESGAPQFPIGAISPPLGGDLPHDLDALLDMLAPQESK